jgi:hypothetical protein
MLRWADKCAEEAYRYLKLDALNACMMADRETALNGFRKRTRENSFAAFAVPEPIGLKSDIRLSGVRVKVPSITSPDVSTDLRPS